MRRIRRISTTCRQLDHKCEQDTYDLLYASVLAGTRMMLEASVWAMPVFSKGLLQIEGMEPLRSQVT